MAPVSARASFAAALFACGFAAIFALERVGAPDALVAALGPLLGLVGLAVVGVTTRARTLIDFIAARREAPAGWAGLALAATVGGFALGLAGANQGASTPWRGGALGVAVAVLVLAPLWRRAHACAMADVFATRFPAPFVRAALSVVLVASGLLLAAAGLGFAALTLEASLRLSRETALALGAGFLFVSLAPGGLRSLVWCDAATAAAGLSTLALLAIFSFDGDAERLSRAGAALAQETPPLVEEAAAACAAAVLFAFCQPAFAVGSPAAARRAEAAALIWLALGALAAAALGDLSLKRPSFAGLASALAVLPALSLARAGLYAAARPIGYDFARPNNRLWVLASQRMAGVRVATALGACAAAALAHVGTTPSGPFHLGVALWLAFGAPCAVLALLPGRSSNPAVAALGASLVAALAGRGMGFGAEGRDLVVGAMAVGTLGLASGLCAFVFSPEEAPVSTRDPFVDLPGEPLA